MSDIFTSNILHTVVQLQPSEFNDSIDQTILDKLRNKVEGKCDRNGYIKPGSTEIVKRSLGQVLQGNFNGSCNFRISFKVDICKLPFDDSCYDLILCNHVLEHVKDHIQAISELHRVLKKGGTLIAQVPIDEKLETTFEDNSITDPIERSRIFCQYDHVRIYGKDFISLLNQSGFKSKGIPYANKLSEVEIKKYSLQKEVIPVAIKS